MLLLSIIISLFCFSAIIASADTIEEKIVYFAEKQGVNPDLAVAIARCEGGLGGAKKNPRSSATGPFQFIRSTWIETTRRMGWVGNTDVWDTHLNVVAGIWLLKQDGVKHWLESKSCWG